MPRRSAALDLALPPRPPGAPAHRWLYDALREAILGGRLRPGARLPGTRELAGRHGLARGTVVRAFEELAAEGYLEGAAGSGSYVARCLPDELLGVGREGGGRGGPVARRPAAVEAGAGGPAARRPPARFAARAEPFAVYAHRPVRAFRADLPAVDLFPTALWAQLAGRRLRAVTVRDLLGSDPLGHRPLREAVADYLSVSRGVRCTAARVAIVSGVQEALDLAVRLALDPGERVAVEEPGYAGAAQLFAAAGAEVVAAPVDGEGATVDPERLRDIRMVYTTPAHQYPLGVTMSLARRLALLDWARRTGARIFEDDYDSEYRYSGRPVPALQGLDRGGSVLFAGSFNKVLFPTLRLGYLVLPDDLVDRAAAVRSLTARHPPLLEQRVLADFLAEGHFGRHLRRMREVYAGRHAALIEAARARLAGRLDLSPVEAGLQTVGRLVPGSGSITAGEVAEAAEARGVEVAPLEPFYRERPPVQGLVLGFAAVDAAEIRRGVEGLAAALEEHRGPG